MAPPTTPPAAPLPSLRAIPLGGLEEIGNNMMVFAYGEDLIVVDAGIRFPDDTMLGVDLLIPDVTYLEEHRDRILGYLITHGHEDHIGALPYILPRAPAPIFASPFTRGLIEAKLREKRLLAAADLFTVAPGTPLRLGPFELEFFHQSHSIPDALGFAIHTPAGTVVHTGDFRFDGTPVDNRPPEFATLTRLGDQGVLALFADSTRADVPGNTPSETTVGLGIDDAFANAKGRVILATFASLISRLQLTLDAAARHGRQVGIVGRSMVANVRLAVDLGHLRVPEGVLLRPEEIGRIRHDRLAILTTGSQGEPTSGLTRMSQGIHKQVQIVPGDTVVISSSPIPGNEEAVGRVIDALLKRGASVIDSRHAQVHVSGHGAAGELELMLRLLRPRYLIPIHGYYRQMFAHRAIALGTGMPEERVVMAENGMVLALDGGAVRPAGRVRSGKVYVSGSSGRIQGDGVVRERRSMARDGILIATIILSRERGEPIAPPQIVLRGFIEVQNADALIEMARSVLYDALGVVAATGQERIALLREALGTLIYQQTKRRPLIVPVVTEV